MRGHLERTRSSNAAPLRFVFLRLLCDPSEVTGTDAPPAHHLKAHELLRVLANASKHLASTMADEEQRAARIEVMERLKAMDTVAGVDKHKLKRTRRRLLDVNGITVKDVVQTQSVKDIRDLGATDPHRPTDPPTHRPADPPTHRLSHPPTHRPTDSPTHRPTDSPTHRLADPPTHRISHPPTLPHTDSPTHRLTDPHTY